MLHARAANIRCDRYCSNFLNFRVQLNKALLADPTNPETWPQNILAPLALRRELMDKTPDASARGRDKKPAALPSWLPRLASSDHAPRGLRMAATSRWTCPRFGGGRISRPRARSGGSAVSVRWRSRNKVPKPRAF